MKSKFVMHPTSDWKMTYTTSVTGSGEQPSIGAGGHGGQLMANIARSQKGSRCPVSYVPNPHCTIHRC